MGKGARGKGEGREFRGMRLRNKEAMHHAKTNAAEEEEDDDSLPVSLSPSRARVRSLFLYSLYIYLLDENRHDQRYEPENHRRRLEHGRAKIVHIVVPLRPDVEGLGTARLLFLILVS